MVKDNDKNIQQVKHELIPNHRILSQEEIREITSKYKIKRVMLPKIKLNDPAIRHLNPSLGDVVEIIRKSPTAGTTKYWRVVIK